MTEVLIAVLILGIVSIGAARLYVTTVGVQHKLTREFDLRQDGLRVLNEIGRGFTDEDKVYGGVHGASKIEPGTGSLELVVNGTPIKYTWHQAMQTLTRTIDTGPSQRSHPLLDGVEQFELMCNPSNNLIIVRLTLVATGKPQPRVELSQSMRPRVAKPICS